MSKTNYNLHSITHKYKIRSTNLTVCNCKLWADIRAARPTIRDTITIDTVVNIITVTNPRTSYIYVI